MALIFIPFMKGESSIILGIVVFSVILFLPVFVIVGELLQSMRENAKRMIACKQLIQEAAAQNMAATNQVTQEFEKAKRDLH